MDISPDTIRRKIVLCMIARSPNAECVCSWMDLKHLEGFTLIACTVPRTSDIIVEHSFV